MPPRKTQKLKKHADSPPAKQDIKKVQSDHHVKTIMNQLDKAYPKTDLFVASSGSNQLIQHVKNLYIVPPEEHITSDRLNSDITRVVSIRAKQIENGSPIYVDVGDETDPIKIAEKEVKEKKCPLSIVRHYNNRAEIRAVNNLIY
jgi:DNA-directed RNA polymerase subunit K/omega